MMAKSPRSHFPTDTPPVSRITPYHPEGASRLPKKEHPFIYERHAEPLLPFRRFIRRLLLHGLAALAITVVALGIGILGYHLTEGLPPLDSLLNASMILGGMGPVNAIQTDAGKLFASFYALFSGMIFLGIAGILLAPIAHRLLHWMHLEDARRDGSGE
jgi:hypothetical protein